MACTKGRGPERSPPNSGLHPAKPLCTCHQQSQAKNRLSHRERNAVGTSSPLKSPKGSAKNTSANSTAHVQTQAKAHRKEALGNGREFFLGYWGHIFWLNRRKFMILVILKSYFLTSPPATGVATVEAAGNFFKPSFQNANIGSGSMRNEKAKTPLWEARQKPLSEERQNLAFAMFCRSSLTC